MTPLADRTREDQLLREARARLARQGIVPRRKWIRNTPGGPLYCAGGILCAVTGTEVESAAMHASALIRGALKRLAAAAPPEVSTSLSADWWGERLPFSTVLTVNDRLGLDGVLAMYDRAISGESEDRHGGS